MPTCTPTCHGPDHKGRYWVFAGLIYLRGSAKDGGLDMTLTDASGARLAGTSHQTSFWNVEEDDAGQALDEVCRLRALLGIAVLGAADRGAFDRRTLPVGCS